VIRIAALLLSMLLAAPAAAEILLLGRAEQGGLITGTVPPGARTLFAGRPIPLVRGGKFLLGIDRDAPETGEIVIIAHDGSQTTQRFAIAKRAWKIEKVDGVPQKLVTPDPETLKQILAESKLMAAARAQLELTPYFESGLIRPAEGRISGVFGSQRILNGTPGSFHAGLDIAAPTGTPVRAAADGVVALRHEMMVMTGNTVVLNHGYGLETVYIHMSKIHVGDGQRVKQGDIIGEIGMTGRASGPHLHFGVTWFDTRLDPETVLAVLPAR
jgi:murein DD-endopeptidase MepM/ murein hydrolase activator NlpD